MTENVHHPGSIDWLSEELAIEVTFVDDPDLKARIYDFLRDVNALPGGDVIAIVDEHLTELRQRDSDGYDQYPMRRVSDEPAEDFPDACEGCEHYGTRCPVFVDPVERQRRENLEREHADSEMAIQRRAYRRYAEAVGCHEIPKALREKVERYESLRERGLELYEESDVNIGHTDTADDVAAVEAQVAQEGR